jgi:uncharacterized protein (DUF486 family)
MLEGGTAPTIKTKATSDLNFLLKLYQNLFPLWTFPFIPLIFAAFFQSLAWMSGPNLFQSFSLIPRLGIMWLLAGGEYLFMMPTMNAGIEVLGMRESFLVVIYQVITLIVFMLVDLFIFKKEFKVKYLISFSLLALAVMVVYL